MKHTLICFAAMWFFKATFIYELKFSYVLTGMGEVRKG